MKHTLSFFIFFAFTANAFCQTRGEAENFIKKYIEGSPQNNGAENEKNDVIFLTNSDGEYLMVYSNYLPYIAQFIYTFSPKDIQSVTIDRTSMKGQNILIKIRLIFGKKVYLSVSNFNTEEYKDSFDIILGNSALADDIPNRLKKAIEHLSRLSGGGVSEDRF